MLGQPILTFLRLTRHMPTFVAMALFRQALAGAEMADDPEREFWRARVEESFAPRYTGEDAVACIENSVDFIEHGAAAQAPWSGEVLFLESDRISRSSPQSGGRCALSAPRPRCTSSRTRRTSPGAPTAGSTSAC